MKFSKVSVMLRQNETSYQTVMRTKAKGCRRQASISERQRGDVVLLSQQEAHTQRVLPRLVWSQSIRAAGHMILSLPETFKKTASAHTTSQNHFTTAGLENLQGRPSEAGRGPACWGRCDQTCTELPRRSASGAAPAAGLHM